MTPEKFRLTLAICAIIAALAYLGSVDPDLMAVVIFVGLIGAGLWLCYRVIRWAWRRIN